MFFLFPQTTNKAKDPIEYDIEIPLEIKSLVDRFDSKVSVKIMDDSKAYAQAPIINSQAAYIVLSKRLFEKRANDLEQFNVEDIKVIVAHELGHIIPKSHFKALLWLTLTGLFVSVIWLLATFSAYSFLTIVFLFAWLGYISREEENRADSFAIIEASISVESFAQCLSKANIAQKQEMAVETPWALLKKLLFNLFFSPHPSIEHRVSRVRKLYGTSR